MAIRGTERGYELEMKSNVGLNLGRRYSHSCLEGTLAVRWVVV
jgi:hypothetical protein